MATCHWYRRRVGVSHKPLDVSGIANDEGDVVVDLALVVVPHVVGRDGAAVDCLAEHVG